MKYRAVMRAYRRISDDVTLADGEIAEIHLTGSEENAEQCMFRAKVIADAMNAIITSFTCPLG